MKINTLLHNNAGFPKQLSNIHKPPTRLYSVGEPIPPQLTLIALVGTRKPSQYGEQVIYELMRNLRGMPIGVVSGLALGTDALAHRAALENNLYTLAVLPSGLSNIYPATNRQLAHKILTSGGTIISEYAPTFRPHKYTFLERNRLIAGLADLTILSEAALPSGSLTTAQYALEYNREVAAVPGPIFSPTSSGTNHLLQQGAHLITSGEDILSLLGITQDKVLAKEVFTLEEQTIINHIKSGSSSISELIKLTSLSAGTVMQQLTFLELKGAIIKGANGTYICRRF